MTRAKLDGLCLLLLGSVVFLLLGFVLERAAPARLVDFRMMYYPARCLIHNCDPYKESEVLRVYQTGGVDRSSDTVTVRQVVTRYVYLPTAFCFTVPFALLPWGPAHMLWMVLTVGSLILGSFLIWNLGATYAPIVSGVLAGFLLANSEVIVITGTAAGIAVSLCIWAVWCFLRDRFVPAGILCLAISLAIKPQDAGLVWLYFLLAGGTYRKRALQTLLATVALSLPTLLWVWYVAPHWVQELHSNMSAFFAHGGINDPCFSGRPRPRYGDKSAIGYQRLLGRPAHLQSGQLSCMCAASARMGIFHSSIPLFAGESLACARGHCGTFHAACLSSAIRR